ncbi:MAG: cohesin domain-containing protein, partial [Candidatus Sumerlaeota bacterium]|nr:cohesin domain-containing protein [Candidatus Sumerlaeota bacterium]
SDTPLVYALSWGAQTNLKDHPRQFSIPFSLNERAGIEGIDFVINFDTSLLKLISVQPGAQTDFSEFDAKETSGQLRLVFGKRNNPNLGGGATMAVLTFEAVGDWNRTELIAAKLKTSDGRGVNMARAHDIVITDAEVVYPVNTALMTVTGVVSDRVTASPLADVQVTVEGITSKTVLTVADGRYEMQVWASVFDGASVRAIKADYAPFSTRLAYTTTATLNIALQPFTDWKPYYNVVYKRDGKVAPYEATTQGIVIKGGGQRDTLKITRIKNKPSSAVILRVASDGSFAQVYTEAPIARLEMTSGVLKSLTAVGANVERILAGEVGTIRMAAAPVGDDGVTTASAYAFTGVVSVSSTPLRLHKPFLAPKIQVTGVIVEGAAFGLQQARATISASTKKIRAADKKSWCLAYGGVSSKLAAERHLRDIFLESLGQPDDLALNIEAHKLDSLSVTGGAIDSGDIAARGLASVTARGLGFTFKRAGGVKYGVLLRGDVAAHTISSGALGKRLSVSAKGGDVRVGDPTKLTGNIAEGGVFSGGAVASVSATLRGFRKAQGGSVVSGGVVGFAPVSSSSLASDSITSASSCWTWIESGVKETPVIGGPRPDIVSVSGDVAVFGVFVAADDRTTSAPNPQASVRSIKTLKAAPGYAIGAKQSWWFSVAGEAWSRNPITPKTLDASGFKDMTHQGK